MLPELIGETACQHSGCQFTIQWYPPLRCRNSKWCVQLGLCCCCCSSGRWQARQDGQPLLSTRSSWLAAIGHDDSSHMRPHRTVQPPPLTRGLQRRSTQPSSFCKRLIASLTPPRVHALSLSRLCRNTDACLKSIFSWTAEATSNLSNCSRLELYCSSACRNVYTRLKYLGWKYLCYMYDM